ncbi:sentrin-specific protease 8 [Nomia melanderi]|uniref:sentrin-specific protease 8 n=1 Tax=Nomia melanderi TaxID=2448451 RepID=UPI0013042E47|nr:sentrin-specific protease 8 [Nomia melanderi]
MAKKSSDEIVLCYYDCVLRRSDVALLQGTQCPELTQLLKLTEPSQYNIFLDSLNALECKCVFFPLNNCESRESAGGSHWSLLLYCKEEKTCYHFDSCKGCNYAAKFARNVLNYMLGNDEPNKKFLEPNCPQQDNGYDCGLYVLCLTDIITEYVLKTGRVSGCDYSQTKSFVSKKRAQLLHLIDELKHTESLKQ